MNVRIYIGAIVDLSCVPLNFEYSQVAELLSNIMNSWLVVNGMFV